MKMCIGLPVIATPIPSYEPVIEQGCNGFLASSVDDWFAYLEELRDPARRQTMGAHARKSVLKQYSKEEQARHLTDVLHELVAAKIPADISPITEEVP
jgi:glycosyltransferase involved in cell wall biosynthesis